MTAFENEALDRFVRNLSESIQNPDKAKRDVEEYEAMLDKAIGWIEEFDQDQLHAHDDIVLPFHALITRKLLDLRLILPFIKIADCTTFIACAMSVGIAKAYEKGKREALAGLVIEGEVLESNPEPSVDST